jgi:hypothetical protein
MLAAAIGYSARVAVHGMPVLLARVGMTSFLAVDSNPVEPLGLAARALGLE